MCKCPECGASLIIKSDAWRAKMALVMRGRDAGIPQSRPEIQPTQPPYVPMTVQPGAKIETPIAQQTIESNVKVPLAQSLVTGAICACAAACAVFYIGFPKPLLLIAGASLLGTYRTWTSGVNFADSLLTRIEDYTGIDINNDGKVGTKPQPVWKLVKVKSGYTASADNTLEYKPISSERLLDVPHDMPRRKEDPWTVERLINLLEQAFATNRWSRTYYKELGISQGQWSVLSRWLGPDGYNVWGTTDRPTLDSFVEQVMGASSNQQGG